MKHFIVAVVALAAFGVATLSLCMSDGFASPVASVRQWVPDSPDSVMMSLSKTPLTAITHFDVNAWMADHGE